MFVNTNESLQVNQRKAEALLARFTEIVPEEKHGTHNPYLKWLNTNPVLTIGQVVDFLKFWYPVSRHQPQILLLCMSAFIGHNDRKRHTRISRRKTVRRKATIRTITCFRNSLRSLIL